MAQWLHELEEIDLHVAIRGKKQAAEELLQMSSAIQLPSQHYNIDVNFAQAIKDSLDLHVAIRCKQQATEEVHAKLVDNSELAVTPALRETPTLATIISGIELPNAPSQDEKDRLRWLLNCILSAPATFFISPAHKEKLAHDFAAVPWEQISRFAAFKGKAHAYQLPSGVGTSCESMELIWKYVVDSGLKRIRTRPSRLPRNEQNDDGKVAVDFDFAMVTETEDIEDDPAGGRMLSSFTQCTWEVQAVQRLLEALQDTKQTVDLSYLGVDLMKLAAPVLAKNSYVSRVLLSGHEREVKFNSIRNVHTLDLSNSNLDDEQSLIIATFLQHNCHALHTLDLRGNVYGQEGDEAFAKTLRHMSTLTCLNGVSLAEKEIRWDLSSIRPLNKAMSAFLTCRVEYNRHTVRELDGFLSGRWMIRGMY